MKDAFWFTVIVVAVGIVIFYAWLFAGMVSEADQEYKERQRKKQAREARGTQRRGRITTNPQLKKTYDEVLAESQLPAYFTPQSLLADLKRFESDHPASEAQVKKLIELGFLTHPVDISMDQAGALLSTWQYVNGVLGAMKVADQFDPPVVKNVLCLAVARIIPAHEIIDRIIKWNERRLAAGRGGFGEVVRPRRDEHFAMIEGQLRLYFYKTTGVTLA